MPALPRVLARLLSAVCRRPMPRPVVPAPTPPPVAWVRLVTPIDFDGDAESAIAFATVMSREADALEFAARDWLSVNDPATASDHFLAASKKRRQAKALWDAAEAALKGIAPCP